MMAEHSEMKLGKRPRRHDERTLKLSRYLNLAEQPTELHPPSAVDYTLGVADFGVMLNDKLGCCTIAAIGHAVQVWTLNSLGRELTVPDSTILEYYEQWDGYDPSDPSSDQGGVELDVLNAWRKNKFAGHSIEAYVAIALDSSADSAGTCDDTLLQQVSPVFSDSNIPAPQIATAIWLFGGAYIGVELPIRAQRQEVWDVPAHLGPEDEPGSWGGHAVFLAGYDLRDSRLGVRSSGKELSDSTLRIPPSADSSAGPAARTLTCITWGKPKKMTLAWFKKYCSEAYALVSADWLQSTGLAPSGFDLETLERDLQEVSSAPCRTPVA